MLLQSSVPFWLGSGYTYDWIGVTCYAHMPQNYVYYFVCAILEFIIPMLVVFPSCLVSVYSLCGVGARATRNCSQNSTHFTAAARRNHATWTIVLLTATYLVFNLPLLVYTVAAFFSLFLQNANHVVDFYAAPLHDDKQYHLFLNFAFTVSVSLNSTANAVLFTLRSTAVRQWLGHVRGRVTYIRGESVGLKELVARMAMGVRHKLGSLTTVTTV